MKNWLLEAMRNELDLKELFDSKICSQLICNDNFIYANQYPTFHQNKTKKTARFTGSLNDLMYGKACYNEVFGEAFGTSEVVSKPSNNNYEKHLEHMKSSIS